MLRILIVIIYALIPVLTWATTLADIKAHEPTSRETWAEQWFYNITDPTVGTFKISFQSYIAPTSEKGKEKAYIHLAFTPLSGTTVKYDLFFDELILTHPTKPDAFYYEVPGVIVANEETITINHDDFNFSLSWQGPHNRYWKGLNPGQTPFSFIPELPGVGGKWFLYTVGTEVKYNFDDGNIAWGGLGHAQVDKGWYDKESSTGGIYTMGLSDDLYFMFTGAALGSTSIELWAGRYLSKNYDLIFYPALNNVSVKRKFDSCEGELHLEMNKIGKKLVLNAKADKASFYSLDFPWIIVFGGEQSYMKSMSAEVDLQLYSFGKLKETLHIPQALLEFSGPFYCNEL